MRGEKNVNVYASLSSFEKSHRNIHAYTMVAEPRMGRSFRVLRIHITRIPHPRECTLLWSYSTFSPCTKRVRHRNDVLCIHLYMYMHIVMIMGIAPIRRVYVYIRTHARRRRRFACSRRLNSLRIQRKRPNIDLINYYYYTRVYIYTFPRSAF